MRNILTLALAVILIVVSGVLLGSLGENSDSDTSAPSSGLLDGVQPAQPAKRKMACRLVIHTGRPVAGRHQISRDCTSVEVVTLASRRDRMTLREMRRCTTSMTAGTRNVPVPNLPLFSNDYHPSENQPPHCASKTAVLYNPR